MILLSNSTRIQQRKILSTIFINNMEIGVLKHDGTEHFLKETRKEFLLKIIRGVVSL